MERDFRIFDKYTNDFIGAFNSTEEKAKDKALQIIKARNESRKQIGFTPYTEIFVSACYIPTEKEYQFSLSVTEN